MMSNDHQAKKSAEHLGVFTTADVRARLAAIRTAEMARYERLKAERLAELGGEEPRPFFELRREREQAFIGKALEEVGLTDEEHKLLQQYAGEKTSWNPWKRAAARRAERALWAAYDQRQQDAYDRAVQQFIEDELPDLDAEYAEMEQRYERYAEAAHAWEEHIDNYRGMLDWHLSETEERLCLLERGGITTIQWLDEDADIQAIDKAILWRYQRIPVATRRAIELERERMRDTFGIDR